MADGLENLEVMAYPGRLIIAGKDENGEDIVVYGLSGRSPSSKARRLKLNQFGSMISIDVTDPKQLAEGNPALLVYDAISRVYNEGAEALIASNGAQTGIICEAFQDISDEYLGMGYLGIEYLLQEILPASFAEQHMIEGTGIDMSSYEPDAEIFTPRISCIVMESSAMLAVVKKGEGGEPVKCFYEVQLQPGKGFMVATYDGANPPKPQIVPSFRGEPRPVSLAGSPQDIANAVYEAMGEFRVSAACMTSGGRYAIKNLHGDGE